MTEEEKIKSKNIGWHFSQVTPEEREAFYGHKGAVIWLTGLPGSGKSTVSLALEKALFERKIHTFILDGDNVRHGLNSNLGFSEEDRMENIRRVGEVAKLFADAGQIVITAFISPYAKSRKMVRESVKEKYIEVFVDCPVEVCEERDPKGLYKKARSGEIKGFTGVSAPYENPENPEITIQTNKLSIEEEIQKIIQYLINKKIIKG